jgi:hypothetical protein
VSGLPEITEVQRLTIRPGDHLVVRAPGTLTPEMVFQIRRRIGNLWPDVPVLVLDRGMTLEVADVP